MINLANNIKFLRDLNNLSQYGFAKLFNLTRGKVASYEVGTEPSLKTLVAMARHFNLTLDELITADLSTMTPRPSEAQLAQEKLAEEAKWERTLAELELLRKENAELKKDKAHLQAWLDQIMKRGL
ncbi:MAG: helix-turn-helix transcriptional regulator [Cytophagales bacterium]|nr:helix-turn-helix domain-containing protein [Bernardetiaceae bacterium]MDW8203482.1 helix-turn-helix transcriptional regulator [Cytophagales bacterium]